MKLYLQLLSDTTSAYIPQLLSRFVIENVTGKAQAGGYCLASEEVKSRRLKIIRRMWAEAKRLRIPIQSPEAPRHWALLVLMRREGGEVEFFYYDTLRVQHQGCRADAQVMIEALEVAMT